MSLAATISLLQTALLLLSNIQATPNAPQSVRNQVVAIAQQAISEANTQLSGNNAGTGSSIPRTNIYPIAHTSTSSQTGSTGGGVTPSASVAIANSTAGAAGSADKSVTVAVTAAALTPIYRFYNSATGEHFLTASPSEVGAAQGYAYEAIPFQVYAQQLRGTVPLYRCYDHSKHFTSTVSSCEQPGIVNEGTYGYIYSTQASGTVPLYRVYRKQNGDHMSTTASTEGSGYGYVKEGIQGYVAPSSSALKPPAPSVAFSASPTSITAGGSSTLTWSSTSDTSCTGTNFLTGGATSGTVSVSPSQTTTYSISCAGAAGSADKSVTVAVSASFTWPTTQTLSAAQVGVWSMHVQPLSISTYGTFFYSPQIIHEGGIYKMWATVGDRIIYYTSPDGIVWTGVAPVFTAQAGTWEDDGNQHPDYEGGISDARVIKGVTPGYAYTMYYTAGRDPNNASSGGIGVAFSNDGTTWTRSSKNPIFAYPGGHAFAGRAVAMQGKNYFMFIGGSPNGSWQIVQDRGDGQTFSPTQSMSVPSYNTFFDSSTNSCWSTVQNYTTGVSSGPTSVDIYAGGNCFTTLGTKVGTISRVQSGMISNFNAFALNVNPDGTWTGGTTVQFIYSAGNSWANWQPMSVTLTKN